MSDIAIHTKPKGVVDERLYLAWTSTTLLPVVAKRIMSMINDESCNLDDLTTLVESSPALEQHVVKAANSAPYRRFESVSTVFHAIQRLGVELARELVLLVAFQVAIKRA